MFKNNSFLFVNCLGMRPLYIRYVQVILESHNQFSPYFTAIFCNLLFQLLDAKNNATLGDF